MEHLLVSGLIDSNRLTESHDSENDFSINSNVNSMRGNF